MLKNPQISDILLSLDASSLILLDIDSTLVQTHQRNQAILEDFCRELGDQYPEDIHKIKGIECRPNDYSYYSALKRLDVSFSDPSFADDLQYYWRRRFFSSDYLHYDQPVPGAVAFVKALQQKSLNYMYLTGRYHRPMLAGTEKSFATLGFPFTAQQLILKMDPQEKDEVYKSREIAQLKPKHSKIVLFDNEPVILNKIREDHPEVELVWFESTHSGRQQPPADVLKISSFE